MGNPPLAGREIGEVQVGQGAAIYARVSTVDQSCERQLRDLAASPSGAASRSWRPSRRQHPERRTAGGSGAVSWSLRRSVGSCGARDGAIPMGPVDAGPALDAAPVRGWQVSAVAMFGMTFELDSPHRRMLATVLAGLDQFERNLISERVKSDLPRRGREGGSSGDSPGNVRSRTAWRRACCGRARTGGATGGLRWTSGSARTRWRHREAGSSERVAQKLDPHPTRTVSSLEPDGNLTGIQTRTSWVERPPPSRPAALGASSFLFPSSSGSRSSTMSPFMSSNSTASPCRLRRMAVSSCNGRSWSS